MEIFQTVIGWMTIITTISAFLGMCFSAINLWRNYKLNELLNQEISIILKSKKTGDTIHLNNILRRRYVSRPEIQGILGNQYHGRDRYDIPYLKDPEYSSAIQAVQNGDSDTITILIDDAEEFERFRQGN